MNKPSPLNDYSLETLIKVDMGYFEMLIVPRYVPHYLLHDYEPYSSKIVLSLLQKNQTFLDLGGHFGYYSLLASKAADNISVIILEPSKIYYQIIKKNLNLNNLKKSKLRRWAASNKNTVQPFMLTEAAGESSFYDNHRSPVINVQKVKSVKLDTVLGSKKIDFIKIDIEGHELPALEGLQHIIGKNQPLLLIELNPKAQASAGHEHYDLIAFVTARGYDVFVVDESAQKLYRYGEKFSLWHRHLATEMYANILCLPQKSWGKKKWLTAESIEVFRLRRSPAPPISSRYYYLKAMAELAAELAKIKSSRLWQLLYLYKHPVTRSIEFIASCKKAVIRKMTKLVS